MLNAGAGIERIRRLVGRIDQSAGAAIGRSRKTAGVARAGALAGRLIHGLECSHPAILGQIVVKETEARANYRVPGLARRIGDSQARPEGPPVRWEEHTSDLQSLRH